MSPSPCAWRPYRSREDAVRVWSRLGGIRVQVMQALNLLDERFEH